MSVQSEIKRKTAPEITAHTRAFPDALNRTNRALSL